jgi:hypothetical protein
VLAQERGDSVEDPGVCEAGVRVANSAEDEQGGVAVGGHQRLVEACGLVGGYLLVAVTVHDQDMQRVVEALGQRARLASPGQVGLGWAGSVAR